MKNQNLINIIKFQAFVSILKRFWMDFEVNKKHNTHIKLSLPLDILFMFKKFKTSGKFRLEIDFYKTSLQIE